MGEVVQLRDYSRKEKDDLRALLCKPASELTAEDIIYCSPPIKDTAPCEFTAPMDDPA